MTNYSSPAFNFNPAVTPEFHPLGDFNGFTAGASESCVDTIGDMIGAIKISSALPSTSSQLVKEVALSNKSAPQPPFSAIKISRMQQPSASSSQLIDQPPLRLLKYRGRAKKAERVRWTTEEHRLFLEGIKLYGEGNWETISRKVVKTRSIVQIMMHAHKHHVRCKSNGSGTGGKKSKSIHAVTIDHIPDPLGID